MDDLWNFIRILQTESITKIKWRGKLCDIFFNRPGIRQGAKLSPSLYKRYDNQLLNTLTTHNARAKIGTTFIGAPTVADDIALIAFNPTDLQCALNIVANETAKDKVTINSSKSAVIIYNANKQREKQEWKLGEIKIEEVDSTTHIGIFRELRGKNDIESRIKKGRSTSYALLGAGLHGENGINPYISYKLCTTFCRLRIIYGLEAVQMLE
jgi:hypothetical protein